MRIAVYLTALVPLLSLMPREPVYAQEASGEPRLILDADTANEIDDLNAADFLLNHETLDLRVMPVTVAIKLTFQKDEAFARQEKMGTLGSYLTARWLEKAADDERRVKWDLALVEAIFSPELATSRKVSTPPENTQREILLYDSINSKKMAEVFWETVGEPRS